MPYQTSAPSLPHLPRNRTRAIKDSVRIALPPSGTMPQRSGTGVPLHLSLIPDPHGLWNCGKHGANPLTPKNRWHNMRPQVIWVGESLSCSNLHSFYVIQTNNPSGGVGTAAQRRRGNSNLHSIPADEGRHQFATGAANPGILAPVSRVFPGIVRYQSESARG